MNLFSLDGKVSFVTGSGSGIGQRLAIGLAEAGASVGCFDLPSSSGLEYTVDRIRQLGRPAMALTGDVTRFSDLNEAIGVVEKRVGPLSIAINSAGITHQAPAEEMPIAQWLRMLDVNLTGIFLSCQAEARVMLPRKQGSIVNIASVAGTIAFRPLAQAHYNSSKAAVIHLSKSLAMEWSDRGVRVNSISPGFTLTPKYLYPDLALQLKQFEADIPLGRMATVDEMVGPAIFLSSQAASFCTGIDLIVDGGLCLCMTSSQRLPCLENPEQSPVSSNRAVSTR
ncbi:MAG: SDR family oxidoreductase [Verrucomicrobia bacterium]|nr:SDR family oxidoreductase [Verrucomicrobiota bacterium]